MPADRDFFFINPRQLTLRIKCIPGKKNPPVYRRISENQALVLFYFLKQHYIAANIFFLSVYLYRLDHVKF